MYKKLLLSTIFISFVSFALQTYAQQKIDTLIIPGNSKTDSIQKRTLPADTGKKKHDPRKATFRSAVLPGWGQAYNKKYWKIPIVYGALGTTAAIYIFNVDTYKSLKQAYIYIKDTIPANDSLIEPRFRNLSPESIRSYRNSYRQNVDYSVLFFFIFWGLNVVDATVDGHLKAFDVSNDISLKIRPRFTQNLTGISLVFSFKDTRKTLSSLH